MVRKSYEANLIWLLFRYNWPSTEFTEADNKQTKEPKHGKNKRPTETEAGERRCFG